MSRSHDSSGNAMGSLTPRLQAEPSMAVSQSLAIPMWAPSAGVVPVWHAGCQARASGAVLWQRVSGQSGWWMVTLSVCRLS